MRLSIPLKLTNLAEISPNKRAGCKDTLCKEENVKIMKGELRFGSWVEIKEHGSWAWKHWYELAPGLALVPFSRDALN